MSGVPADSFGPACLACPSASPGSAWRPAAGFPPCVCLPGTCRWVASPGGRHSPRGSVKRWSAYSASPVISWAGSSSRAAALRNISRRWVWGACLPSRSRQGAVRVRWWSLSRWMICGQCRRARMGSCRAPGRLSPCSGRLFPCASGSVSRCCPGSHASCSARRSRSPLGYFPQGSGGFLQHLPGPFRSDADGEPAHAVCGVVQE